MHCIPGSAGLKRKQPRIGLQGAVSKQTFTKQKIFINGFSVQAVVELTSKFPLLYTEYLTKGIAS